MPRPVSAGFRARASEPKPLTVVNPASRTGFKTRDIEHDVAGVLKPVLLAGLTAVSGFGSLALARNPALTGLGVACAIGIFWSLVATIFFTLPAMAAAEPKVAR